MPTDLEELLASVFFFPPSFLVVAKSLKALLLKVADWLSFANC